MKVREIRRRGHREESAFVTTPSDAGGGAGGGRGRVSRARDVEFEPVYHFYGPHRAGLPPLTVFSGSCGGGGGLLLR